MATSSAPAETMRPEDERLPIGSYFAFGLQHVLTMYGGIIAVPLIMGGAAGLSPQENALLIASCLFVGGLSTILQSVGLPFFGSQLPLVQGVSFASVATMGAIVASPTGGLPGVFGAVMAAGVLGLLIAPFFAKIVRFFPPVVTGVIITAIGLSLLPVAARWAGGNVPFDNPEFGDPKDIGLAAFTLLLIIVFSKVGIGILSRLSILLAIVAGTIVASVMGMADFSSVGKGAIVAVPTPFHFGAPTFSIAAIISMFIVILVIMTETTADIIAVGEVVGTEVDSRRIADGLRADMVSTAVAPVFNSFPQSAFAQNVGLVAISGVRSRFVVTAGGAILLVLGLFPVIGRIIAAVPYPVLGGAGIVLFGTVAAAGIRTLSTVKYEGTMNLILVAVALSFGMLPVVATSIYDKFPEWFNTIFHSGISSAAVMAVLLNLVFNVWTKGTPDQPSVFVEGYTRILHIDELGNLQDGDTVRDGKVIDVDGDEVPVCTPDQAAKVRAAIDRGEISSRDDIRRMIAGSGH